MSARLTLVALTVLAAAFVGVVLVAQVEWPGTLADCVISGTCDCEAIGRDGLRQPVNAVSSLGLLFIGALVLAGAAGTNMRLLGAVVLTSGVASFLSHAAVRDWSHTLDSLGVKAVLLFLIIYPLTRPRPIWPAYTLAVLLIWAGELVWPATSQPLLIVLVAAAVILNLPEARQRTSMQAAMLVMLAAAVAWGLGRSASPLCDPDSLLQPHALWHLLVAAGLAAVYDHYRLVEQK